ncbi:polysaccharide pyruvyl transferase family protein [Chryseobacterium sp. R2A-55]|uniref:polysaccharide pyruvyl transferase family protein n=1 Tax=Chryseobacterium sp. R2A-55 TaxID=2744445 RepID=UPI001F491026|nr:polysaccharide pyruvyl transferase family protein [Chryseobacterium sp. R2A-55]
MRVLLFFHGGSQNRGCEAIVRTAVGLLRNETKISKIGLASMQPNSDQHILGIDEIIYHNQERSFSRFSPIWFRNLIEQKFLNRRTSTYRWMHQDIISKLEDYDVFLSIGGDNYCYGELPDYYELDRVIKSTGKKLVFWGASIGEEDLTDAKIKDLKTFDLVLVRESLTEKILNDAGIPHVKPVADGAFLMKKTELPLPENWKDGRTVGFNFSPLVFKKNPGSKKAAFDLVEHILNTTDFNICLTPHVIINGNNDHDILLEFYQKFKDTGRMILLPDHLNATEYKGYISRMRFFIGARTHATIAAYSTLVPTLVLGYSVKSRGIAKDLFGEEKLVLSLDEISDAEKLIAKFEEMKAEEEQLRKILVEKIPDIKKMAEKAKGFVVQMK